MKDTILFGDCRETLSQIDEKVRMCVTSPPYYGLRNYGDEDKQIGQEDTPEEYINNLVNIFRSVRNCLSDDGTLWVNIGDSYYNYRPGKGQALVQQTVAVFPPELITPCILAGSEKNDIVLDPFMGSGTTAMVARDLGRHYIGCELHEEYNDLIQQRVPGDKVVHNGLTNALNDL